MISRYRTFGLIPAACGLFAACAAKPPILPSGTGTPFPEVAAAYQQATASCRTITTLTATLAISGRAGTTKLRGRIDAGFEAPSRARLEGIAPFGKPVFVLVTDGDRGTLVLPREDRVLADAPPEQIVEALAGVSLGPDALRTLVSGCGLTFGAPADGRSFGNGWVAGALSDGMVYMRQVAGAWIIAAAVRGPVTITYADYAAGRPATIHLRAAPQGILNADLTLRLSDVEINTPLDPRAFKPELPDHPVALTLEELRRAGPLGGS